MPIKTIIVGTDFSDEAENALHHAMSIARHTGAEVSLLHALNLSVAEYNVPYAVPEPDTYATQAAEIREHARATLEDIRQRHLGQGVELSHVFIDQLAGSGIVSVAKTMNADLIVMGSHGRGRIAGLLMGSVSQRVAKKADCDVLVARGKAPNGSYKHLLVPVDFTEASDLVIGRAMELVEAEGVVELLHCWQLPGGPGTYWGSVAPVFKETLMKTAHSQGEALIEKHRALLDARRSKNKVQVRFKLIEGDARRCIKERSKEEDFDLVVVGTHSRKGLERLLLGSVAETTVRDLEIPVYLARGVMD